MAGSLEEPAIVVDGDHARASQLVAPGELPGLRTAIWMGGSHTHIGVPLAEAAMETSWVIDCAGGMPPRYRVEASRWVSCVFADIDARPTQAARIEEIVREVAVAVRHPEASAADIFVVCQHGMNRSGLVAGLLLRELGFSPADAVSRITERRPGALSNVVFRQMLLAD